MIFRNSKNPPETSETIRNTHLDLWKNTGPSRAKLYVTRRAVVSRVIRMQRRYAVQIRPMESVAWAHFRQIFDLFIELYSICTHFSHIEYVLRIHLVKISLIFINMSRVRSGQRVWLMNDFFLTHTW